MNFLTYKKAWLLISLVCLCLFCSAKTNVEEQHLKVVLRTVGHEFLLQMGDSSTRVLPVKKEDKRYSIQFAKEIAIEPDLVSYVANKVFKKELASDVLSLNGVDAFENGDLFRAYIMEVEDCTTKEVVYSFEYNSTTEEGMVPCKSRPLPIGCYKFYFTFIDENTHQLASTNNGADSTSLFFYWFLGLLFILMLLFYLKKRKSSKKDKSIIAIGNYKFDKHSMKLMCNGKVEELSSKEVNLLELFSMNKNKTLERDYILNQVWNDEGDYVGRTLDVSISKLRKKLNEDASLKIVNIRGVGYRFTVE